MSASALRRSVSLGAGEENRPFCWCWTLLGQVLIVNRREPRQEQRDDGQQGANHCGDHHAEVGND
jgi:hypothetical protein